jgi:proton-dependent oligopeptide transporter, POT family
LDPSIKTETAIKERSFLKHPIGLKTLFLTEMWERFSYYGMRAILILFMVTTVGDGGLGMTVSDAGAIYGIYTSMIYLACLPGGWCADRLLGQRNATLIGGIIIMLGHILLAIPGMPCFFTGLVFLVVGTGLLKPSISSMVGQLYGKDDQRRDAGYSIYYMGINIGAFASPLVCGWLSQAPYIRTVIEKIGFQPSAAWHFGFGAAAIGMAIGLLCYIKGSKSLGQIGLLTHITAIKFTNRGGRRLLVYTALFAAAISMVLPSLSIISLNQIGNIFGIALFAITFCFFFWLTSSNWENTDDRVRVFKIVVLFVAATIFWSLYEQGGSTLTLFAERNTSREILGFSFPSSWMQSLNPIYIILFLGPGFAWLWIRLGSSEPSTTAKFSMGLFFMALGWFVMVGAAHNASNGVLVSPSWLACMYLLHSIGEMCLSPVGLSAMSKLAPQKIASLTMGIWFLASSVGSYVAGRVSGLYETLPLESIFITLCLVAFVASLILLLMSKFLEKSEDISSTKF